MAKVMEVTDLGLTLNFSDEEEALAPYEVSISDGKKFLPDFLYGKTVLWIWKVDSSGQKPIVSYSGFLLWVRASYGYYEVAKTIIYGNKIGNGYVVVVIPAEGTAIFDHVHKAEAKFLAGKIAEAVWKVKQSRRK